MGRPRKQPQATEPVAQNETQQPQATEPVAVGAALHTPESLGYKPGDTIPLCHLNLIGTPIV